MSTSSDGDKIYTYRSKSIVRTLGSRKELAGCSTEPLEDARSGRDRIGDNSIDAAKVGRGSTYGGKEKDQPFDVGSWGVVDVQCSTVATAVDVEVSSLPGADEEDAVSRPVH